MRLSISKRQSTAPRPTKHLPLLNVKVLTQLLNVGHKIPISILFNACLPYGIVCYSLIHRQKARSISNILIVEAESNLYALMTRVFSILTNWLVAEKSSSVNHLADSSKETTQKLNQVRSYRKSTGTRRTSDSI